MADESVIETPATPEATPAATPAAPAVSPDTERLAAIDKRIAALADTVQAALAPRRGAPASEPAAPGSVPSHFRGLLKQQGLTDADIDANAPIIVPFLSAMLATDGAVIASGIQQVKDDVEMVRASRNAKRFPYWNDLEDKIVELRDEAAKQNQYLSPSDAYRAAIALDVQAPESRIEAAKARIRSERESNSADVSAQNLGVHHGARQGQATVRRTAMSAEEVAALPRAERKKLYESLGDLPIR